jgi:1,4-alpha-glucan branching enzyme
MGWMNDTLRYMSHDPIYRAYQHDLLTFSQIYAYTENFVLPLSHDEVVHGKKSLIDKMPGDVWQRFANLRLLFCYQMTHPGKKLNFMGNEFAHGREWSANRVLDWDLLDIDWHEGVAKAFADRNRFYVENAALHHFDFTQDGFEWIDCHDNQQSVISYIRKDAAGHFYVVILNFTPAVRYNYRIGMPQEGAYEEIFNSDHPRYQGSGVLNQDLLTTDALTWLGRPFSLCLTLPPLAGVILKKV